MKYYYPISYNLNAFDKLIYKLKRGIFFAQYVERFHTFE
jgi:hypothetical protein